MDGEKFVSCTWLREVRDTRRCGRTLCSNKTKPFQCSMAPHVTQILPERVKVSEPVWALITSLFLDTDCHPKLRKAETSLSCQFLYSASWMGEVSTSKKLEPSFGEVFNRG